MTTIPPIVSERREGERRAGWHTPETCDKVIGVQAAIEGLRKQLDDGDVRMGCMEDNIAGNHRVVCQDIKSLEVMLEEHKKELAATQRKQRKSSRLSKWARAFSEGCGLSASGSGKSLCG
ncbi:MAG: hypothetical protein IPH35_19815 [Rhodoferax sp.]|nr:hypothetical protein [Rhodoferax sp.]